MATVRASLHPGLCAERVIDIERVWRINTDQRQRTKVFARLVGVSTITNEGLNGFEFVLW